MKKNISIILLISTFILLCSCSKKGSEVTVVTKGLSFTAEITNSNLTNSYTVETEKDGTVYIKSNLTDSKVATDYKFKNGSITYIYNGLEYSASVSSLPDSFTGDLIPTVLQTINEKKLKYKNKQYYIEDNTDKYKFTVYCGASGLPIKITEHSKKINVIIKNISVK